MKIFLAADFLRLLLVLLPLLKPAVTASPMADEEEDRQAHPLPLQRRDVVCNPDNNPNLNLQSCLSALQRIPGAGIGRPLGGFDPSSPNYLPRGFTHDACQIVVQLEPGLDHVLISWATVRHRASLLVNMCVGGVGAWAPGYSNHGLIPGRSGNDTYGGVRITVDRFDPDRARLALARGGLAANRG